MELDAVSRKISARHFTLALIFFAILLQAGCTTYEINSIWRTDEIIIDGKSSDWVGKLGYIVDAHVSVGVQNDQESLYICLIAEHQFLSDQVMSQGMTLWFDPSGGKNKTFGIKFPLGRQFSRERRNPMSKPEEGMNREKRREEFKPSFDEIEILYPEDEKSIKISIDEAKGINIALAPSSGILVYELKVPIIENELYPYALGAKRDSTIGIGVEIPKMDRSAMRNARSGGMGGGRPGGRMAPAGGGRGGSMGRRPEIINGLKIWAVAQLASETIIPPPNQPPS